MNSAVTDPDITHTDEPTLSRSLNLAQAKKKIMDFLARRNHSESELRTKLNTMAESAIVEQALSWGKQQSWFPMPENLTATISANLSHQGKSLNVINENLKSKGLPQITSGIAEEYEKAKKLVLAKWSSESFSHLDFNESQKTKTKIVRFIISRGFELEIAQSILKNELQIGVLSNDQE